MDSYYWKMSFSMFIRSSIWVSCIVLVNGTASLYGQIDNGGFEDWYFVEESKEYPVGWDEYLLNSDDVVKKSTIFQEGLYSVSLASLNFLDGGNSPGYLVTKLKPSELNLKFSFYYQIDSIEGQCNAVVGFYQQNGNGDFRIIKSVKYNEVADDFIQEEIDFSIQTLDSLAIELVAENHPTLFGHDGFIRVLFDNVKVDLSSSLYENSNDHCVVNTENNGEQISLSEGCNHFNTYKIFSVLGQLVSSGVIAGNSIGFSNKGMYILSLFSNSNDIQTFRLINY
jgi:hypothetical protein